MSSPATAPPPAADPGLPISVAGKVMLSGVVIFFFLFVLILILILRANRYIGANPTLANTPARFILPFSVAANSSSPRRKLDPAILRSLPVTVFSSAAFNDAMECSVCLAELADGEASRFLPACRHAFHLQCIDMWFGSNSTCPLCRRSVVESKNVILGDSEQSSDVKNRALGQGIGEGSSSAVEIQRIAFALHSSRRSLRLWS